MRISSVNTNIRFTSIERAIFRPNADHKYDNVVNRNNSWIYRDDVDWVALREFLIDKYKDIDKVNLYCYACSDGSEPYTLAMELDKTLGDRAKKFFPIIAKDIDDYVIRCTQTDEIYLTVKDTWKLKENLGVRADEYLVALAHNSKYDKKGLVQCNRNSSGNFVPYYKYQVQPKLKDKVIFSQADFTKDIKSIKPNYSVVLCRNMWPYLNNLNQVAADLYESLGKNSLVLIGEYDSTCNTYKMLKDAGFHPISRLLFEKRSY